VKYTLICMRPIDDFDCAISIQATPNPLEELLGRKKRVLRYFGSGTTWRNGKHGPRCNCLTSEWLHGIWNRELKRAVESAPPQPSNGDGHGALSRSV
jgi:hypothetical protein